MLRKGFLICLLSTVALCRNEFPNEVVVTSADVVNKQILNIGKAGETYRLYAINAGYVNNDETLTRQIVITDSTGKTFKLNELRKVEIGSYFLSPSNIVTGPISVYDPLPQPVYNIGPSILPYTIYIVATSVPPLPVVEAIDPTFVSSARYNGAPVRGLTLLSSEMHFSLRKFNITTKSASILTRGYDLQSSSMSDSIMELNQQNAYSSYVTIFGPIATIINTNSETGDFLFTFDVVTTWGGISPGAALTLLSHNWLSLNEDYSSTWSYSADSRQFEFGVDTPFNFDLISSDYQPGETVTVEIRNSKQVWSAWSYGASHTTESGAAGYGTTIRFTATGTTSNPLLPPHLPRYRVKITSGSNSISFYSLILVVVLIFRTL